jgi:hypothetical protein
MKRPGELTVTMMLAALGAGYSHPPVKVKSLAYYKANITEAQERQKQCAGSADQKDMSDPQSAMARACANAVTALAGTTNAPSGLTREGKMQESVQRVTERPP